MNKPTIICLLLLSLGISSCFTGSRKYDFPEPPREPEPVALNLKESSALFNEQYFNVSIDSLNNTLLLSLSFKSGLKNFPFPKDKAGKELTATCFHFELLCNGQPVPGPALPVYARNQRIFYLYGYNEWLGNGIDFTSDTVDLKNSSFLKYEIPYFAFNKLKSGMKVLELKISQGVFCSGTSFRVGKKDSLSGDSIFRYVRNRVPLAILKTKAVFKLNVPKIYKTALCNEIIELKDDSTYSPAGSDNTIWNSSYPDLYWSVYFPLKKNYARSDYQKSTAQYTRRDTFYVFHYGMNDSIDIAVWDHDNLSSDDFIAQRRFAMSQFKPNKTNWFSFGAIRRADIKILSFGVINN